MGISNSIQDDSWMLTTPCSGRNITWQYMHSGDGMIPSPYDKCKHAQEILNTHCCKKGTCKPYFFIDQEFVRYTKKNWDGLGDPLIHWAEERGKPKPPGTREKHYRGICIPIYTGGGWQPVPNNHLTTYNDNQKRAELYPSMEEVEAVLETASGDADQGAAAAAAELREDQPSPFRGRYWRELHHSEDQTLITVGDVDIYIPAQGRLSSDAGNRSHQLPVQLITITGNNATQRDNEIVRPIWGYLGLGAFILTCVIMISWGLRMVMKRKIEQRVLIPAKRDGRVAGGMEDNSEKEYILDRDMEKALDGALDLA